MSKWKHNQIPEFVQFYRAWPDNPGFGKWVKRNLHKARRRAWKQGRDWRGEKESESYRGSTHYESEVNYKAH